MFDWEMFCAKVVILPNLFDIDRKETIPGRMKLSGVFSVDFEQAYGFLVSNTSRLIQLSKSNSWTK